MRTNKKNQHKLPRDTTAPQQQHTSQHIALPVNGLSVLVKSIAVVFALVDRAVLSLVTRSPARARLRSFATATVRYRR